jgi:hypothetical protein
MKHSTQIQDFRGPLLEIHCSNDYMISFHSDIFSLHILTTFCGSRYADYAKNNRPAALGNFTIPSLRDIEVRVVHMDEFSAVSFWSLKLYCITWFIVSTNDLSHDKHGQLPHDHRVFRSICYILLTRYKLNLLNFHFYFEITYNTHLTVC